MLRILVLVSILFFTVTSTSAHCLDTDTVVSHFTGVGDFGLPSFLGRHKDTIVRHYYLNHRFDYPVFWVPSSISLGSGTGIDDTHECSLKRARIGSHIGLQER